jgi:hypothetical protein
MDQQGSTQTPVTARSCGFESHLRHKEKYLQISALYAARSRSSGRVTGGFGRSRRRSAYLSEMKAVVEAPGD